MKGQFSPVNTNNFIEHEIWKAFVSAQLNAQDQFARL